jgi:hypothetical protein
MASKIFFIFQQRLEEMTPVVGVIVFYCVIEGAVCWCRRGSTTRSAAKKTLLAANSIRRHLDLMFPGGATKIKNSPPRM